MREFHLKNQLQELEKTKQNCQVRKNKNGRKLLQQKCLKKMHLEEEIQNNWQNNIWI